MMTDLSASLDDYLKLRRALGYKLSDAERHLRKFIAFLEVMGEKRIITELALRWATSSPNVQPAEWTARLRAVRHFARYRSCWDPRTEIPPEGLLPHRHERATPYIYSSGEIAALIGAARQLPPIDGLRGWTVSTLLGLLAVTGLRVGEALALDRQDVDLAQSVLHIRQTKFGKSRLVPVHRSTRDALSDYIASRDGMFPRPDGPWFFTANEGWRLSYCAARNAFVRASRQVGLRSLGDTHGPRLHDFRHSFAVRTLIRWYRQGRNVEHELPKLSTYLGHTHWADTYWYLTSVPELMKLASDRLEKALGGSSYDQ